MAHPRLSREWLTSGPKLPANLSVGPLRPLPERIVQFGEGNFLRSFVDWMVDGMNSAGLFGGGVVVVQPIPQGKATELDAQGGCYTVLSRGLVSGKPVTDRRLVTSVQRALDLHARFADYRRIAAGEDLRFVVSNTTEAGIAYAQQPYTPDAPQPTFPAKVCAFLHDRFSAFEGAAGRGLVFLPCELSSRNGSTLREYVLRHAADWGLGRDFARWVEEHNVFCNTLVDRIVPGYPAEEAPRIWDELGYEDRLLTVGEHFHLWVIEGPRSLADELPLAKAGFQVVLTDDLDPYRNRKVLVLNGAHTSSVLAAFHAGLDTVEQMMSDPCLGAFVARTVNEEILPALDMDPAEKRAFADAVLERFRNPFIRHELLSIALNSVSKWKVRVLPSLKAFLAKTGSLPAGLSFSLAALIHFYLGGDASDGASGLRGGTRYPIRDDEPVLAAFAACRGLGESRVAERILADAKLWGEDLRAVPGLAARVAEDLARIRKSGVRGSLEAGAAPRLLRIHPDDHVAVALTAVPAGTAVEVEGLRVTALEDVPAGHKLAVRAVAKGAPVVKYGSPIGTATQAIQAGQWVHEHNLRTALTGSERYRYQPVVAAPGERPVGELTFEGYGRAGGQVGIRNEIWIVPTVGCVNGVAAQLARRFADLPAGVDGVHVLAHPYGCSQLGDDHERTRNVLASLVHHPNAAGVLVLGLGCENNTMASFRERVGPVDPDRFRFLVSQEVDDELAVAERMLSELVERARADRRSTFPASALKVGLKCGGSDGYSGITANPLVGRVSDLLGAAGGTTVLTEVPEAFGAEGPLLDRAVSREVFDEAVAVLDGFKHHFLDHGHPVSENPSPGNRLGGITTLEEKSLGCTQKGGRGPLAGVVRYGDRVRKPGLNLLEGPGNDIVAVTALAAAGCQLVFFTTGRGTPLGGPVPVIKVATNSDLARRKRAWIDLDAGRLLEGADMASLSREALQRCLEVASGRLTASEELGSRDLAIWRGGITL